jgi:molecular chaperone DnaK
MPQIEVTFDINADGILEVSAQDKATGKQQSVRIEASSGLTEQEIDKMVNDAKANEQEDADKAKRVEIRNQADQAVYAAEKNLSDIGDKIDADTKAKIEAAMERVKTALKGDNVDEIKAASDDLNTAWHAAAQQMYQQSGQAQGTDRAQQAPPGGGPDGGQASASPDDSVDADFEVVDDDEK